MTSNINLAVILPTVLSSRNLDYRIETPVTASRLISEQQLSPSQFIELFPEIERTLLVSFIEDDYDGKLHFMTLNECNGNKREVVAIAFWREVDDGEMKAWLDLHRVKEILKRHAVEDETSQQPVSTTRNLQPQHRISFKCESDNALSKQGKQQMEMIRSDSITWIRNALNSNDNSRYNNCTPTTSQVRELLHSWIKIELIAIKSTHRHHSLGEILLLCLLSCAYSLHGETHAILHIAGDNNVAANRLYTKFGFVHLPKYEEGGPFEKPDRSLFVLGDIGGVLKRCPWKEMRLC